MQSGVKGVGSSEQRFWRQIQDSQGVEWAIWKVGLRSDLSSAFSDIFPFLSILRPRVQCGGSSKGTVSSGQSLESDGDPQEFLAVGLSSLSFGKS